MWFALASCCLHLHRRRGRCSGQRCCGFAAAGAAERGLCRQGWRRRFWSEAPTGAIRSGCRYKDMCFYRGADRLLHAEEITPELLEGACGLHYGSTSFIHEPVASAQHKALQMARAKKLLSPRIQIIAQACGLTRLQPIGLYLRGSSTPTYAKLVKKSGKWQRAATISKVGFKLC
eukprot:g39311.t1